MTRDEAVKRLWVPSPAQDWAMGKTNAEHFVDQLVALGALKLDKPKTYEDRLSDFANDARFVQGGLMWRLKMLPVVLDECGLKIVEK